MSSTETRRSGPNAISTRVSGRECLPDRGAVNAARVNAAETRAEAQIEDVVSSVAPRIYADAGARSEPARATRICIGCGVETTGSVGAAGLEWPNVCQPCKNDADRALARRVAVTSRFIARVAESTGKPKANPIAGADELDAPRCKCGCREFVEVEPMADEPELGLKGHAGGLDCSGCGAFIERERIDPSDD